jgi:hypothetical protein
MKGWKMVAKQVAKSAKGVPNAVKAKGAKVADEASKKGKPLVVVMPNKSALTLDAGPKALKFIGAFAEGTLAMEDIQGQIESDRYMAQTTLALACYKAATNDKAINLADAFSDDNAAKNKLGKQIRLALGLAVLSAKGKVTDKADVHAAMYATPEDDARIAKKKESVRTNFSTMLTKCMRVALDAVESGYKMELDKGYNTLRLTGPAIEKHFGMASVVLNEDQNAAVIDKRGKPTGDHKPLKVKPSFTEIARRAANSHGKQLVARKDSRTQAVDPLKHMVNVCSELVKAIEKLPDEIPDPVRKALESVQSAIETALE